MTFWRAVTYRLFAGGGEPSASLRLRAGLFAGSLSVVAILMYRVTPRLMVVYPVVQVVIVAWMSIVAFGLLAGLLTDSYQRAFLTKLDVFTLLPLTTRRRILARAYALLPINLVVSAIAVPACMSLFSASVAWYLSLSIAAIGCAMAITGDAALRLSNMPPVATLAFRVALIAAAMAVARPAFRLHAAAPGVHDFVTCIGFMAGYWLLVWSLMRHPLPTYNSNRTALPVIEGRLSIMSALPVRALRTMRYMGTNVVLLGAVVLVFLVARATRPLLPLDSIVFIAFLLIGTLGQEARALSNVRYPLELSLYGAVRQWLAATWALAFIHGLLWVDICLAVVRLWSQSDLGIGYLQAGVTGMCFIAAGIAAGSIVVPQKNDILAQYASTTVYGLLIWLIVKGFGAPFGIHVPLAMYAAVVVFGCLMTAGMLEYWRWHKTIRRKICTTTRSRQ